MKEHTIFMDQKTKWLKDVNYFQNDIQFKPKCRSNPSPQSYFVVLDKQFLKYIKDLRSKNRQDALKEKPGREC